MTTLALPSWSQKIAERKPGVGYSYLLKEHFALTDPGGLKLGVNESEMCATFVLTEESPDRVGDVILTKGIRLSTFSKNPIAFFDHRETLKLPLGKWESRLEKKFAVWKEAKRTCGTLYFSQKLKEAEQIFALVLEDILRSVSVGFTPLAEPTHRDYGGNPHGMQAGLIYPEIDLIEASVVGIGCHPAATLLRSHLSKGIIAGMPIDPVLYKSLSPLAEPTPIWSPGGFVAKDTDAAVTKGDESVTATAVEKAAGTVADPKKFSSTQVNLPPDVASRVLEMGKAIPDGDLASDGRESEPHATVKYGLHTEDPNEVRRVIGSFGPIRAKLGKVSLFPAKEASAQRGGEQYDVVKIDVDSEDLKRLNKLISDNLECTDTHPVYHPHCTICYTKAGRGEKHVGADLSHLPEMAFNELVFSDKTGGRHQIPLGAAGGPTVEKAPEAANEDRRLWVYECPTCSSDAYNGVPGKGVMFRGGGKCSVCGETFSVIGLKPKSKEGPLLGSSEKSVEKSDYPPGVPANAGHEGQGKPQHTFSHDPYGSAHGFTRVALADTHQATDAGDDAFTGESEIPHAPSLGRANQSAANALLHSTEGNSPAAHREHLNAATHHDEAEVHYTGHGEHHAATMNRIAAIAHRDAAKRHGPGLSHVQAVHENATAPAVVKLTVDQSHHGHDSATGQFASRDTGKKPRRPSGAMDLDSLIKTGHAKAQQLQHLHRGHLSGAKPRIRRHLTSAGNLLKRSAHKMYVGLKDRYGHKQALGVMAAAMIEGWQATEHGAAHGTPVWLPGGAVWASVPFESLAEVFLHHMQDQTTSGAPEVLTMEEIEKHGWAMAAGLLRVYGGYMKANAKEIEAAIGKGGEKKSVDKSQEQSERHDLASMAGTLAAHMQTHRIADDSKHATEARRMVSQALEQAKTGRHDEAENRHQWAVHEHKEAAKEAAGLGNHKLAYEHQQGALENAEAGHTHGIAHRYREPIGTHVQPHLNSAPAPVEKKSVEKNDFEVPGTHEIDTRLSLSELAHSRTGKINGNSPRDAEARKWSSSAVDNARKGKSGEAQWDHLHASHVHLGNARDAHKAGNHELASLNYEASMGHMIASHRHQHEAGQQTPVPTPTVAGHLRPHNNSAPTPVEKAHPAAVAHLYSELARDATGKTEGSDHDSVEARRHAILAERASAAGNPWHAAEFHARASHHHNNVGNAAHQRGDHQEATRHFHASDRHDDAATMQARAGDLKPPPSMYERLNRPNENAATAPVEKAIAAVSALEATILKATATGTTNPLTHRLSHRAVQASEAAYAASGVSEEAARTVAWAKKARKESGYGRSDKAAAFHSVTASRHKEIAEAERAAGRHEVAALHDAASNRNSLAGHAHQDWHEHGKSATPTVEKARTAHGASEAAEAATRGTGSTHPAQAVAEHHAREAVEASARGEPYAAYSHHIDAHNALEGAVDDIHDADDPTGYRIPVAMDRHLGAAKLHMDDMRRGRRDTSSDVPDKSAAVAIQKSDAEPEHPSIIASSEAHALSHLTTDENKNAHMARLSASGARTLARKGQSAFAASSHEHSAKHHGMAKEDALARGDTISAEAHGLAQIGQVGAANAHRENPVPRAPDPVAAPPSSVQQYGPRRGRRRGPTKAARSIDRLIATITKLTGVTKSDQPHIPVTPVPYIPPTAPPAHHMPKPPVPPVPAAAPHEHPIVGSLAAARMSERIADNGQAAFLARHAAGKAVVHAREDENKEASTEHEAAGGFHDIAGDEARMMGKHDLARLHESAAANHRFSMRDHDAAHAAKGPSKAISSIDRLVSLIEKSGAAEPMPRWFTTPHAHSHFAMTASHAVGGEHAEMPKIHADQAFAAAARGDKAGAAKHHGRAIEAHRRGYRMEQELGNHEHALGHLDAMSAHIMGSHAHGGRGFETDPGSTARYAEAVKRLAAGNTLPHASGTNGTVRT